MKTTTFTSLILNLRTGIMMLALLFSVSLTFVACGGSGGGAAAGTETEEVAEEEGTMSFTEEDIEALKAKFTLDESGWYNHTLWSKSLVNRRTLTALVYSNGSFVLSSNYYAEKALKHNQIKVKVGDMEKALESNKVDLKSNQHQVQEAEGKIYEINSYSGYGDNGIFQAIAESPKNTPVNVTFQAKSARVEGEISRADIEAIRDCHKLSLVLRMTAGQ